MKKLMMICVAFAFFAVAPAKAQKLLDKMDKALDKADRASNTAGRTKNTGDKIGGFFKKKDGSSKANTTIEISGIDLTMLKKLEGNVKACKGVTATELKYSANGSAIYVVHSGSTSDLFDAVSKSSTSIFKDDDLETLEDGKIAIVLKKK